LFSKEVKYAVKSIKNDGAVRCVAVAVLLCGIFAAAQAANAALLPDELGEWQGSPVYTTEFSASKAFGQWSSRTYTRTSPIASVEVHLMEGIGPGSLFVPEGNFPIAADAGPLGPSSTYETLNIAGYRAILERGELTGQSLAVALAQNRTLTLENKSLSTRELLDFAENFLAALAALGER
jgi:hypothetical protein